MNKKKLALTLLLSSASVSVFAADAAVTAPATVVSSTPATATVVHPAVVVEPGTAGTKTVVTTTPAPVVEGAPVVVGSTTTTTVTPATTVAVDGYFASAWKAAQDNRVATAVLVTSSVLVGAIIHAAVSSNNTVDADDAE